MTGNQVVSTMFNVKTCNQMVRFVSFRVHLEDPGLSYIFAQVVMDFVLSHITRIHLVLVMVVLSSHHGSTLVSSSHDCVQSVSTTMDLHCIGRQPCYESYNI